MKRAVCLTMIVVAASLSLCQSAAAQADRKLSVAASIGSYPFQLPGSSTRLRAARYGLEIGYQISGRLRISGEFQYVDWSTFIRIDDPDTGQYQEQKGSYGSTPILLSLTYVMPIDETFTFFLGAGAGYHPFAYKTRLRYDLGGGEVETLTEYNGHGIVPHVGLGLEAALSKRISVFGQVRQLVGSFRSERTDEATGVVYETRHYSAGIEVLAGIRIHI